jgi:predicted phage terminase large subunit-like protein
LLLKVAPKKSLQCPNTHSEKVVFILHAKNVLFFDYDNLSEELKEFKWSLVVCSWDTAFKEKELNDPSACTIWGINDTGAYLLWVINERLDYPSLRRAVIENHEKNKAYYRFSSAQVPVLIEDKASGQSLIQELKRSTSIPVIGVNPENNKQIRLDAVAPLIEAGRVFLPDRAPWLVPYETELTRFPLWRTDDLVDSTSQFLQWAGKPRFVRGRMKFWK